MGSILVKIGNIKGVDYRIYNIDNIYTVYIKIDTQPDISAGGLQKPIFSAIKSFSTLKEAKDYVLSSLGN